MANIRVRSDGKLYFDFQYKTVRCREYSKLNDTKANRKRMEAVLKRIVALIELDQFNYKEFFPTGKRVAQFEQMDKQPIDSKVIPTFKEFTEQWYDEMSVGWRKSYQKTMSNLINVRLIPEFGDKVICDISKTDVLQFRASLAKVTTGKNKTVSAQHINRHIKVLKMIVNEAADRHDFSSLINGIKPLKARKVDIKPFTLQEVRQIIDNVRFDFKNYYIVRFFTGMRTAEIDGLQWKYVDFERGDFS